MHNLKKLVLLILTVCISQWAMAQNTVDPDTQATDGFMRTEGKIYVVAAVCVTILVGLIIYVARLDKKISKLEKGMKH